MRTSTIALGIVSIGFLFALSAQAWVTPTTQRFIVECADGMCRECILASCTLQNDVCSLDNVRAFLPMQEALPCSSIVVSPHIIPTLESRNPKDGLYYIETEEFFEHSYADEDITWNVYEVVNLSTDVSLSEMGIIAYKKWESEDRVYKNKIWLLYYLEKVLPWIVIITVALSLGLFYHSRRKQAALFFILGLILLVGAMYIQDTKNFDCILFDICIVPA